MIVSFFSPPECEHGGRILWIPAQRPSLVPERLAEWHNAAGSSPHLIWDAATGAVVEMIHPGFRNALFAPDDPRSALYAVEIVPDGSVPFWKGKYWEGLLERLEALSVPPKWPLGPPETYARYSSNFSRPGHYGAEQVSSKLGAIGPVDTSAWRKP